MTKLKALARDLGVTTADQLLVTAEAVAKAKDAAPAPPVRERWSSLKRAAFDALEPAALCLVATDGPLSLTLWGRDGMAERLGHNRGVWPAKIARTASWRDTVTASYDKSPLHFLGCQFRVWCASATHRDRLAESVVDLIGRRAEEQGGLAKLRHDFQDLGPELDLDLFELEVVGIAGALGLRTWDDEGLSLWLDRIEREAARIAKDQGIKVGAQLMARLVDGQLQREKGDGR